MTVKIEGLDDVLRRLNLLDKRLRGRASRNAASAGARVIRDEAKARAPVDTGLLKKNIVIKKLRGRNKLEYMYGVGYLSKQAQYSNTAANRRKGRVGESYWESGQFYAIFPEFGTSKMPAKPYLRPAFEAKKMEAVRVVEARLKEELDKL